MRPQLLLIATLLGLVTCTDGASDLDTAPASKADDLLQTSTCFSPHLKLNEVQSVGSHNSYKLAIPRLEMLALRRASPEAAHDLDYAHLPLSEQLDLGMRQLELDVFYDPDGGRYANPYLPGAIPSLGARYNIPEMELPGFKVMHAQDVDQRSHCALFTDCLKQIRDWSEAHPEHTPILILINAKQARIDLEEAVVPLPFTGAAFDALDAEILSTLPAEKRITPAGIQGNASTLREAILGKGWPAYQESQGRLIIALDESPAIVDTYLRGESSLKGRPMFVNSINAEADHAAYFTLNNPLTEGETIRKYVEAGFLVRTRADADTVEARTNDTARREAAFASGAQYISTDYYVPRASFSEYNVRLPNGQITQCRP